MFSQQNITLIVSVTVLLVVAVVFVLNRVRLRRARTWPTQPGKVDSTAVKLETSGSPPNMSSAHVATVSYSYAVGGTTYAGALRRRFVLKGSADKWIGKYPAGSPLTIHYNPANAKDSALFDDEKAGITENAKPLG